MTDEKSGAEQAKPGVERVPEEESLETSDFAPPLEEFADLTAWSQRDEAGAPPQERGKTLPGMTADEAVRPKRYGLVAIIILVLLGVVVAIVGVIERHGLVNIMNWASSGGSPKMEMVDSRQGKVLMLETQGDFRRVIVKTPGQATWQLVSRDDTTAINPALSPDGRFVAYVSAQEDGQIVVVSLIDDALTKITSKEVGDIANKTPFLAAQICSWTPVAWDPDGRRVAFFGCREKPALSVVYVADLSGPNPVLSFVTDSEVDSGSPRQLQWSGSSEITVIGPSDDAWPGGKVKTLFVP